MVKHVFCLRSIKICLLIKHFLFQEINLSQLENPTKIKQKETTSNKQHKQQALNLYLNRLNSRLMLISMWL